jgi:hypothetical protein
MAVVAKNGGSSEMFALTPKSRGRFPLQQLFPDASLVTPVVDEEVEAVDENNRGR